jgi:multiple sugar transport system permease protein
MNRTAKNLIIYAILTPVLLLVHLPLFWMILTALKQEGLGLSLQFIPDGVNFKTWDSIYTLDNLASVLNHPSFPFWKFALNSTIIAGTCAVVTVVVCTMAGYGFAKKKFAGRDKIFAVLIAIMLVPGLIFMVPQYAVVLSLGWLNTLQGLVLPHTASIFGLFLLRQHIQQLPDSLIEAAKVDGAGEILIFRVVIMPLCVPIMVTLFLLTFVGQWSNFLWQLIINTPDSPWLTLPVGLEMFKGQYTNSWELMMSGACMSILPIALLFFAAQRFFVAGLAAGGDKE